MKGRLQVETYQRTPRPEELDLQIELPRNARPGSSSGSGAATSAGVLHEATLASARSRTNGPAPRDQDHAQSRIHESLDTRPRFARFGESAVARTIRSFLR